MDIKQIQPITIDLLHSLPKDQRHEAIQNYHAWLKKVREEDKKIHKRFLKRIQYCKHKRHIFAFKHSCIAITPTEYIEIAIYTSDIEDFEVRYYYHIKNSKVKNGKNN